MSKPKRTPEQMHVLDCLGKILGKLRRDKGITKKAACIAADVHKNAVGLWEHGLVQPSILSATRIAHILGTTVDDLVREAIHLAASTPVANYVPVSRRGKYCRKRRPVGGVVAQHGNREPRKRTKA